MASVRLRRPPIAPPPRSGLSSLSGMATLRFTTAGESHGPGLVAVVEGLPAGLEIAPGDIDRDLARRQLGHGRGGRMKIESDSAQVWARHPARPHAGQSRRAAGRQPRPRELGRADEPLARRRGDRGGPPAAPRPRRPGRRDEVRPHRRAQRAGACERARDRGARGGGRRSRRRSCGRWASRSTATWSRSAP